MSPGELGGLSRLDGRCSEAPDQSRGLGHLTWEAAERERGSGTVLALGVLGVVMVFAVVLAGLASAQGARGRAQLAADLGALAGASAARHGEDACAIATQAVDRNGARPVVCTQEPGGVVQVDTSVPWGRGLLGEVLGDAEARARAGPSSPGS